MMPILRFNSVYLFPHAGRFVSSQNFFLYRLVCPSRERGYNLERLYNYREGLTGKDDSCRSIDQNTARPKQSQNGRASGQDASGLLQNSRLGAKGAPTKRKLRKLGIQA
jgi:hypothetical protein